MDFWEVICNDKTIYKRLYKCKTDNKRNGIEQERTIRGYEGV